MSVYPTSSHFHQLIHSISNYDTLVVASAGSIYEQILYHVLRQDNTHVNLVLLLSADTDVVHQFNTMFRTLNLPLVTPIMSSTTQAARHALYIAGGILAINPHMLLSDLLNSVFSVKTITRVIICDAHEVYEGDMIDFILTILRTQQFAGALTAITQYPGLMPTSYVKLQSLCRVLHISNLLLLPKHVVDENYFIQTLHFYIPCAKQSHSEPHLSTARETAVVNSERIVMLSPQSFPYVNFYRYHVAAHPVASNLAKLVHARYSELYKTFLQLNISTKDLLKPLVTTHQPRLAANSLENRGAGTTQSDNVAVSDHGTWLSPTVREFLLFTRRQTLFDANDVRFKDRFNLSQLRSLVSAYDACFNLSAVQLSQYIDSLAHVHSSGDGAEIVWQTTLGVQVPSMIRDMIYQCDRSSRHTLYLTCNPDLLSLDDVSLSHDVDGTYTRLHGGVGHTQLQTPSLCSPSDAPTSPSSHTPADPVPLGTTHHHSTSTPYFFHHAPSLRLILTPSIRLQSTCSMLKAAVRQVGKFYHELSQHALSLRSILHDQPQQPPIAESDDQQPSAPPQPLLLDPPPFCSPMAPNTVVLCHCTEDFQAIKELLTFPASATVHTVLFDMGHDDHGSGSMPTICNQAIPLLSLHGLGDYNVLHYPRRAHAIATKLQPPPSPPPGDVSSSQLENPPHSQTSHPPIRLLRPDNMWIRPPTKALSIDETPYGTSHERTSILIPTIWKQWSRYLSSSIRPLLRFLQSRMALYSELHEAFLIYLDTLPHDSLEYQQIHGFLTSRWVLPSTTPTSTLPSALPTQGQPTHHSNGSTHQQPSPEKRRLLRAIDQVVHGDGGGEGLSDGQLATLIPLWHGIMLARTYAQQQSTMQQRQPEKAAKQSLYSKKSHSSRIVPSGHSKQQRIFAADMHAIPLLDLAKVFPHPFYCLHTFYGYHTLLASTPPSNREGGLVATTEPSTAVITNEPNIPPSLWMSCLTSPGVDLIPTSHFQFTRLVTHALLLELYLHYQTVSQSAIGRLHYWNPFHHYKTTAFAHSQRHAILSGDGTILKSSMHSRPTHELFRALLHRITMGRDTGSVNPSTDEQCLGVEKMTHPTETPEGYGVLQKALDEINNALVPSHSFYLDLLAIALRVFGRPQGDAPSVEVDVDKHPSHLLAHHHAVSKSILQMSSHCVTTDYLFTTPTVTIAGCYKPPSLSHPYSIPPSFIAPITSTGGGGGALRSPSVAWQDQEIVYTPDLAAVDRLHGQTDDIFSMFYASTYCDDSTPMCTTTMGSNQRMLSSQSSETASNRLPLLTTHTPSFSLTQRTSLPLHNYSLAITSPCAPPLLTSSTLTTCTSNAEVHIRLYQGGIQRFLQSDKISSRSDTQKGGDPTPPHGSTPNDSNDSTPSATPCTATSGPTLQSTHPVDQIARFASLFTESEVDFLLQFVDHLQTVISLSTTLTQTPTGETTRDDQCRKHTPCHNGVHYGVPVPYPLEATGMVSDAMTPLMLFHQLHMGTASWRSLLPASVVDHEQTVLQRAQQSPASFLTGVDLTAASRTNTSHDQYAPLTNHLLHSTAVSTLLPSLTVLNGVSMSALYAHHGSQAAHLERQRPSGSIAPGPSSQPFAKHDALQSTDLSAQAPFYQIKITRYFTDASAAPLQCKQDPDAKEQAATVPHHHHHHQSSSHRECTWLDNKTSPFQASTTPFTFDVDTQSHVITANIPSDALLVQPQQTVGPCHSSSSPRCLPFPHVAPHHQMVYLAGFISTANFLSQILLKLASLFMVLVWAHWSATMASPSSTPGGIPRTDDETLHGDDLRPLINQVSQLIQCLTMYLFLLNIPIHFNQQHMYNSFRSSSLSPPGVISSLRKPCNEKQPIVTLFTRKIVHQQRLYAPVVLSVAIINASHLLDTTIGSHSPSHIIQVHRSFRQERKSEAIMNSMQWRTIYASLAESMGWRLHLDRAFLSPPRPTARSAVSRDMLQPLMHLLQCAGLNIYYAHIDQSTSFNIYRAREEAAFHSIAASRETLLITKTAEDVDRDKQKDSTIPPHHVGSSNEEQHIYGVPINILQDVLHDDGDELYGQSQTQFRHGGHLAEPRVPESDRHVWVDVRELRAQLTYWLFKFNMQPQISQFSTGDYMLLHGYVGVERKSPSDLLQSLRGRLFSQLQKMSSTFPVALILIEWNKTNDFSLFRKGAVETSIFSSIRDYSARSGAVSFARSTLPDTPLAKCVMYMLLFPKVHWIWSSSSVLTCGLFEEIQYYYFKAQGGSSDVHRQLPQAHRTEDADGQLIFPSPVSAPIANGLHLDSMADEPDDDTTVNAGESNPPENEDEMVSQSQAKKPHQSITSVEGDEFFSHPSLDFDNASQTTQVAPPVISDHPSSIPVTNTVRGLVETVDVNDQVYNILCTLPGIGDSNASKVLHHFSSLHDLFTAPLARLEAVLGPRDAGTLYRFITNDFSMYYS